jgi:tetratricopeptide (TPR) repeat protein
MIATANFVFIHMHKTGGQTLNSVIQKCIPDHRVIGYHYPRKEIPPDLVNLPVVGIVRNPWDWYVSWYAFNRRPKLHNQLFNVISDGGKANFKTTVTNLVELGSDTTKSKAFRDDLIRMLPTSLEGNRGLGLAKDSIREFSNVNSGYYSWLVERMLGNGSDAQTYVGRFENLENDFVGIMHRLSVSEAPAIAWQLEKSERRNVSRHSHYSHYYDDELRDLIASKERSVIEQYGYEFESVKPAGVAYDFPASLHTGAGRGFQKLLGRERNYLQLHHDFDVSVLRNAIEQIPPAAWLESERERLFAVHKDTQSIQLVHFEDFKHEKPEYSNRFFNLQDALNPLVDYVACYYQNNGFIVRLLVAKLLAGGRIPHHTDAGFSLLNCHRVHIPITTNDQVVFSVGGETKTMHCGEFWEINNGEEHAVDNGGDDRIHIIIDWMPNYAGRPEAEVLKPDDAPETVEIGAPVETINAMLAQAHQVHRSGNVARAESLYRQVLHLDDSNVIANNLLGLLCLQTRRCEEAANYIGKALAENPDDPQAHSNLALALKDLNRPEEAEKHFHESLKLNPNNPRVYNNLGGVYIELRRVRDAIRCYEQALAIQPGFAEVHYNLGSALMLEHQYGAAAASLQQCVTLKPDFTEGQTLLMQALKGLQNQESQPRRLR